MRSLILMLVLLLSSACTAMVLGGGSSAPTPGGTAASSDAAIAANIREHFASDSTLAAYNLGVRSYSGNVTLTGAVKNYVAREQAGRLAKATNGVRTVTNQIVVEN